MKTMDLNAQEAHLLAVLSSQRFLRMEGLSNEVPFFIYPFPPEASLAVAQAKKRIKTKLSTKHGVTVREVNLYDLSVEILKGRGVWERVLAFEPDHDKDDLREMLQAMLDPQLHLAPALRAKLQDGAFDIVRGQSKFINQENYEVMDYVKGNPNNVPESEMGYRFMGLGDFVAERDPKRIGVNYAEKLSLAEGSETYTLALTDGISYADHLHLSKALGDKYAKRMVSAENMILDYLTSSVAGEIVLFGGAGLPRRIRTFQEIVPGVTTLRDVGGSWFSTREWDHDESAFENFPLQHGDMFQSGMVPYYILREGETGPPPEVQRSWDEVVKVRKLISKNIRVGDTGREALSRIIGELEEAGFAYIDRDRFDPSLDPEKTQVHLDLHQTGKGMLAPRVSPMGARWHADKKIPLLLTLGIEYMVHMPVPEWGEGRHIYYCSLHERGVVTERGVEFAAPPVVGIQNIR